jgi:branched-chain amino acid transport system substrate-binding protein
MKKLWIGIGVVVVVVLAIVFIVTQTKKEPGEVKIGTIFALTGDAAKYGERAKKGVELALEEINAKGGIRRKKVKIIYEDSQGDPQKAVSSFQKLVDIDKVKFIIGPLSSPEVLAIAPIAEKKKVIILTPTASAPQITHAGDYIFRNVMSDIFDGEALAVFVFRNLKKKKAGIIYINNDFGIGLKESFKKKFDALGGSVVVEESFERRDMDFRTQLTRIKAKNVEVLFVVGYAEMGQVLRQIKEMGIKTQIVSLSMFEDPEILKVAGDAAEGVYYTYRVFDPKSEEPVIQQFTKRFKEKYKEDPDIFSALSYDAMRIFAHALEKGGIDIEGCKKALHGVKNFPGVVGRTTFDTNGDVIKPIGIKMVKNGKFVWIDKKFDLKGRER